MSQQQLPADLQPVGNRQARRLPVVVAVGVLTLVGALASCGGDDDAADGSGPATAAVETTAPDDTASEGSAEVGDSTDAPDVSTAEDSVAVDGTTGDGTEASRSTPADTSTNGSPSAAVDAASAPSDPAGANDANDAGDTSDTSDAAAADDSTDPSGPAGSTDPSGSTGDSTDGSGPTTTGPTCEFTENSDYPLERCDTGPAVAVLQQTLQIEGFQIGVDGLFGDETLYAVRAFQEEGGMTVDGIVGEATWSALDPQNVGSDDDGNGVVDPDEVDLAE